MRLNQTQVRRKWVEKHLNAGKAIGSLVLVVLLTLSLGAMVSAKTQLTFWTMWTSSTQLAVQREWAEDFGKLHPDVEVIVEAVPWGESYPKYQAAMAAEQACPILEYCGQNLQCRLGL